MTCNTSEPHSAGIAWAIIVADTLRKAQVKRSAMLPAIRPNKALSVRSCRMRRCRLAPSERRRHSSLWREAARASCRLATLAQAITSTIPTATMMSRMAELESAVQIAGERRARRNERGDGFTQLRVRIVQGAEVVGEERHLSLCLTDGDTGREPSKEPAPLVFAIVEPVSVGVNQRHKAEGKPEIRRGYAGAHEVVRRDADDSEGEAIESHDLAEHGWISGESLLPVAFADEHGGRCSEFRRAHRIEGAAAQGVDSKD